jgi:hypothetical protein
MRGSGRGWSLLLLPACLPAACLFRAPSSLAAAGSEPSRATSGRVVRYATFNDSIINATDPEEQYLCAGRRI